MAVKQTAGRDALGEFAPKFAELNDEVLFGQVWSREDKLSLRDRSLVTVVALMAQGLTDSSFRYHLTAAKNNGITRTEIAEILTHAAFYAGWPKAWAAFRMAKEVWAEDAAEDAKAKHQSEMVFPIGASNDGFAPYFSGMLPYKSLHLSSVKDRFGIYALVDKNENRDKGICKPRTSVRKQLSETKQAASPKKAAARSKQHEMEV